jgi:DNA-binding transcriptional LysR family regulator
MDESDLRAFLAVADELHFGRAAAALHRTPPPLTRQIQQIEARLGTRLFERTKRSVRLTAAGAALVGEARQLLDRIESLPGMVQRAGRGETGSLRAGTISAALLSQALALQRRMRASLPDAQVSWKVLSSAEQVHALRQQRIDLGFVHSPLEHEGLAVRAVLREPLVLAVSVAHRFASRRSVALRELRGETFIVGTRDRGPSFYDRFIVACHDAGFEPRLDEQRQTLVNFVALAALGVGVALLPASVARIRVEGVAYVGLRSSMSTSEVSALWDPDNPSPLLARALSFLRPLRERR